MPEPSSIPDPAGLLTLVLTIVAGAILALALLELLLFAALTVLLSLRDARPRALTLIVVLVSIVASGAWAPGVTAQDSVSQVNSATEAHDIAAAQDQEDPTIEARFTRIFSSDSLLVGTAALSPDGRWLAFSAHMEGEGHDIWVVSARGGDPIRLTNGLHVNQIPQWFPSGDRIAFASDQPSEGRDQFPYLMSIPIDPESGRPTGPARQVSLEPVNMPSISPDGRWIAYCTFVLDNRLRLIPSEGGTARTLFDTPEGRLSYGPAWSSDGSHVYFTNDRNDPRGDTRLMRVGIEGGEAEVVSAIHGDAWAKAPGIRYLAGGTEDEEGQNPVMVLRDRQGRLLGRIPLHRNMSGAYPFGFTHDGTATTAVVSEVVARVTVVPLAGGAPRWVSDGVAYDSPLGWTPDNQRVFHRTRLNGREAVLLTPVQGGPTLEIPLPEDASFPMTPSADGRYLAYGLGPSGDTRQTIMIRRISDGETRVLTDGFLRGLIVGGGLLGPGGGVTDRERFLILERHGSRLELRASAPEGPSRLIRSFPLPESPAQEIPSFGVHGDWIASAVTSGDSASLLLSTGVEDPGRPLFTVPGSLSRITWSYDRRWIVAAQLLPQRQGPPFRLLLVGVSPDGTVVSGPQVLETEAWVFRSYQWLPDNRTIALVGAKPEAVGNYLWLIPIRGEGPTTPLSLGGDVWGPGGLVTALLSPDGRQVAYGREIHRGSSVWIVDYGEFLRERGLVGG